MQGYVRNGDFYSILDEKNGRIEFLTKGRKVIGQTRLFNKDIKAIGNYQTDSLKLLNRAWGQPFTGYSRPSNWYLDYDYYINNGIAAIYKGNTLIAAFVILSDNMYAVEYLLDVQFRLIERYINPQRIA